MAVDVTISGWMPIPAEIGADHIFAIGDVHGMSAHFKALLDAMAAEASDVAEVVVLGDLIDRGPDSIGVVRAAARPAAEHGFARKTVLIGNHELMMLDAMRPGPAQLRHLGIWNGNGGDALLRQIGITPHRADESIAIIEHVIRREVGADAMAMIENADSHRIVGNLLLVHGGVHPEVPIDVWFAKPWPIAKSGDDHFAWVRRPFLRHQGPFEGDRIVVHGHSPEHKVMEWKHYTPDRAHMLDGWRIGLDGGSAATGRVVGAEFRSGRYRVYTAA